VNGISVMHSTEIIDPIPYINVSKL